MTVVDGFSSPTLSHSKKPKNGGLTVWQSPKWQFIPSLTWAEVGSNKVRTYVFRCFVVQPTMSLPRAGNLPSWCHWCTPTIGNRLSWPSWVIFCSPSTRWWIIACLGCSCKMNGPPWEWCFFAAGRLSDWFAAWDRPLRGSNPMFISMEFQPQFRWKWYNCALKSCQG